MLVLNNHHSFETEWNKITCETFQNEAIYRFGVNVTSVRASKRQVSQIACLETTYNYH